MALHVHNLAATVALTYALSQVETEALTSSALVQIKPFSHQAGPIFHFVLKVRKDQISKHVTPAEKHEYVICPTRRTDLGRN